MDYATPPIRFPQLMPCFGCQQVIHHPHWVRRDALDYAALCPACLAALDASFTAQHAIVQALAICHRHSAEISGRVR